MKQELLVQQPKPRSKAREFAFKFIYQFQLPDLKNSLGDSKDLENKLNDFKNSYAEKDSEHPDNILDHDSFNFSKDLIEKTIENWDSLEDWVASKAKGWKLENMDKIDLSILMICACEMKIINMTPGPIVINEGVNLAKKFGSGTSFSFINGILDALSKD